MYLERGKKVKCCTCQGPAMEKSAAALGLT